MTVPVATVHPAAPKFGSCGGVVGSSVISMSAEASTESAVFSVFDTTTGTEQSYSMTGSGGHNLGYGIFGCTQGGGVVCATVTAKFTDSQIQLVRMYPDGAYDLMPTTTNLQYPQAVAVGSTIWMTPSSGFTQPPTIYDLSSSTIVTGTGMSAVRGDGQSLAAGGYVYVWSASTLYKYNTSTYARTTVGTGYANYPFGGSQVASNGSKHFWVGNNYTTIIELDTSTDTVTIHSSGLTWYGYTLTMGADGLLYGGGGSGGLTYINSWNPTTSSGHSDATGLTGLSRSLMCFTVGGNTYWPTHS